MTATPSILVAVDFSGASAKALERAARVAKRFEAAVVLVHAFSAPVRAPSLAATVRGGPYVPILEAEIEMHEQEVQNLSEKWAKPLRDDGLSVDIVAEEGTAAQVVLDAAKRYDPEMIVMGRHGHGKLRRMVVGSQTRHISEHSKWPVLIVPDA